uniref:Uncharacterized protein n=1 Tax=Glossina palpalis gambiensis TaxID=67801 RepID=A0A1B0BG86_9MUSC
MYITPERDSSKKRFICQGNARGLRICIPPTAIILVSIGLGVTKVYDCSKLFPARLLMRFSIDAIDSLESYLGQMDVCLLIYRDETFSKTYKINNLEKNSSDTEYDESILVEKSGRLCVLSFGERPQTLLNHTEQFDRAKLVNPLNFSQVKTKIAELLDFIRVIIAEECCTSSDNGIFENLLLILSDGRNIFSEGKTKVKNSIELARLQRVFLVYIIINNPENKNSILDI